MERHAIALLCYNQLKLTQDALASALIQDIGPLHVLVVNNGSTDGTREWLGSLPKRTDTYLLEVLHLSQNQSPVRVANMMAAHLFGLGYSKFLGMPNDVIIPSNLYRLMDQWPRGFVTASQTGEPDVPIYRETANAVSECTPMAVMLTRKWAYDALRSKDRYFFDERYWNYCSDCDMALRMAACGIRGIQLDALYYHVGSATLRFAPPEEKRAMEQQADADREYFVRKWGFKVDAYEYGAMAQDINFRAIPK